MSRRPVDEFGEDDVTQVEAQLPWSALRWDEPTYQAPPAGIHDNNLETRPEMPAVEG